MVRYYSDQDDLQAVGLAEGSGLQPDVAHDTNSVLAPFWSAPPHFQTASARATVSDCAHTAQQREQQRERARLTLQA
jgi:hypothetical protein